MLVHTRMLEDGRAAETRAHAARKPGRSSHGYLGNDVLRMLLNTRCASCEHSRRSGPRVVPWTARAQEAARYTPPNARTSASESPMPTVT
ncbi:hypothetical protein PsYK624_054540 [Phanerochaete sordida]|uniref:Uncharacterized protein n=1 Tax=Phanerochaete sordida TaxID=48140 RepID=A0A9P3G8E5_9APHY|nr:hypothetical protein PsYK624_054540 [Phanerochaete sordida]